MITQKAKITMLGSHFRIAASSGLPRPLMATVSSSPRMTFSATVITLTSWKCWCTMPMPCWIASRGLAKRTSCPLMRSVPSSG